MNDGDKVMIGPRYARKMRYEVIVGKEGTVINPSYGRRKEVMTSLVSVNGDWYRVAADDCHPVPSLNEDAAFLLYREGYA